VDKDAEERHLVSFLRVLALEVVDLVHTQRPVHHAAKSFTVSVNKLGKASLVKGDKLDKDAKGLTDLDRASKLADDDELKQNQALNKHRPGESKDSALGGKGLKGTIGGDGGDGDDDDGELDAEGKLNARMNAEANKLEGLASQLNLDKTLTRKRGPGEANREEAQHRIRWGRG
jgi:hypothetical protein